MFLVQYRVVVSLKPVLENTGHKGKAHWMDSGPSFGTLSHPTGNSETPAHSTKWLLDCSGEPESPEETHPHIKKELGYNLLYYKYT